VSSTSSRPAAARRRPRGPRAALRGRTEQRILDGALRAVARHGIGRFAMDDVSECAGVSRGTAYRYFPSRATLLSELGRREAERFERRVWEALEAAPREERLAVALDWVVRLAREHPLLGRLPETDPGLVLTSLRERFPEIRAAFHRLLGPLLAESSLVRGGLASVDDLVNWMARVMVSTFLFPDPSPDAMAESLHAVWRRIAGPSRRARRR
jgi:AcrR family transcriptional regulator